MTHNEAAFVSCGAASGILLCVAACITGTDARSADELPDTRGMRNQIIMRRCSRGTEANAAIRAAGGLIVDVGTPDSPAPASQLLDTITPQTAAIVLITFESQPERDVASIVRGAAKQNVPVLIDGACAIPPKSNLWHYTRDLGAAALITSGGKAIRGPQSTGLVLGRQSIVDGCKFHSSPNLRIGRGMKVGKEEFAGIFTALKMFLQQDEHSLAATQERQIQCISAHLRDLQHLRLSTPEPGRLDIDLDASTLSLTAEAVAKSLLDGTPSILLRGRGTTITVRSSLLQHGEDEIVARRLREALSN